MTMNRLPFLPLALCAVTFLAGVSVPHRALAAQGEGNLAQAPLSLGTQVPPAFLMAVDDSGSMTFEVLFAADEQAYWGTSNACLQGQVSCPNGFFLDNGELRTAGRGGYYHIIQNGIRLDNNRLGIPPLDLFGFARSPDFNGQYFDPTVTYLPWQNADGTFWPNSPVTAARSDPRPNGSAGTRGPNPIVTYNFTTGENRTDNYFAFRVQPGMYLPPGTQWRIRSATHGNGCGGLGTSGATRDSWQTVPALPATGHLVTATNNLNAGNLHGCELLIQYFPAVVYLRVDSPPPPGFNLAQRVLVPNAGGPGVPLYKYELRAANFSSGYDAVIQNFANWYTYYGNRTRAMVSSMSQSLQPINRMRIGYFTINRRTGNNPGMAGGNVTMRDMAAPAQKNDLYADLFTLPSNGGTPNRSATVYMGDQFRRTDAGAPIQLTCQKNAGMLFTDGYTNEGGANGNVYRNFGDTDGAQPAPIGGNNNGNTIADIAYSFYANNLRTDLLPAGRVPVPEACRLPDRSINPNAPLHLDCQTNLHMNFYGITLGTAGEIYGVDMAATNDPYANPPSWSATGTQNLSPRNVDDIWHATLNTRGKYISARVPTDVTTAMRQILQAVGEGAGPAGSIALSGARVGDASTTVIPEYAAENSGTDWYGRLRAEKVTVNSAGAVSFAELWEASALLPVAGARNILFARPATTVTPTVSTFTTANVGALTAICNGPLSRCSAAEIAALGVTPDQAISYLRGNQALEGSLLRDRSTRLGDIINSSPVISSPKDNFGYRALYGANPADIDPFGYAAYMTAKATRRPMVYVGANDGMLHAFDGETGVERFAYIPSTALGHMGNLLFPYRAADGNDQKFQHRYFVDGPVTVSDARWGGAWRTVLVGSAGAGGKGVFALNVTNPTTFTGSSVLWEVSGSVSGTTGQRIGHVLGKPVVVPMRTGTTDPVWRAVFGNGFGSTSGAASLFVVDIATGNVTTIPVAETGGPATPNGLGSVVLVDRYISNTSTRGSDGYADTAYAGDLHGNIWKFDLRNNTVANGGQPIFTASVAGQRQPITGGLEVASGPGGGVLIYFGTGSFSFENDAADQGLQSLYSVLDTGSTTPNTVTRANLAQQTLVAAADGVRSLAGNAVNYVNQRGWYMDLATVLGGDVTLRGERFVGNPRLQSGLILFPTFEPAGTLLDPCATGGTNWLYALNAISGGAGLSGLRANSPTGTAAPAGTVGTLLDTAGTIPVKDVAVLLPPPPGAVDSTATAAEIAEALGRTCDLVISVAGAPPLYLPRACGRQSWRQVR